MPYQEQNGSPRAVDSAGLGERPTSPREFHFGRQVPVQGGSPRGYRNANASPNPGNPHGRRGRHLARRPSRPYRPRRRRRRRRSPREVWIGYFNEVRSRGLPVIVDSKTGARMRMGIQYPMRGGGTFEIVRMSLDYPARVLIRLVPDAEFGAQLWQSRASTYRSIGLDRLAMQLGSARATYRWIPIHRLEAGRAMVSLPAIDLGRVLR